ncbi:unnamed protein product [Bemisia tabaci]|uniref:RAP domain-containing protein n=1 Tax=Bemisia tabaci TaxID=7038 RepID=A0A9P0APN6_BEMTA|nr:unnamed protein product [Bemisia tabaci]
MTMPPNLAMIRSVTAASVFKTCNHLKHLKLLPSTTLNPISKQSFHIASNSCSDKKGHYYDPFAPGGKELALEIKSTDDQLLKNLEHVNSVEDILSLVRRHLSVMNASHKSHAILALFKKYKNNLTSLSKEEIVQQTEFKNLCNASVSHLRLMELSDQINWLKCLSYFRVPANTRIMQVLLNLISKQVNHLSIQEIVYIDFLLSHQDKCPLVDALQIALPIVFEVKVEREMDSSNLEYLRECLQYASSKSVSKSCFNFLVSLLSAYDRDIPPKVAASILRSLCAWPEHQKAHAILLLRVMDITAVSAHEFDISAIIGLLSGVLKKAEQHEAYRHAIFIDEFIKQMPNVSSRVLWQTAITLFTKLTKVDFSSPSMADFMCRKIEENAEAFLNTGLGAEMKVIHSLSRYSNLKPKSWDAIETMVLDKFRKHLNDDTLYWPKICLYLAILDCWPAEIYLKAADENVLKIFGPKEEADNRTKKSYQTLIDLHQAVHLLYPGNLDWSLPKPIFEKASASVLADLQSSVEPLPPLLPALAKGLGGQEYIHNNVLTQHLHFIDHVIIMRKGGYPTAVPSNSSKHKLTYLQDISVPSESLIVGVLAIKPSLCSFNGQVMSGEKALYIRTLEAMGIAVVPVFLSKWDSLLEHEKIPYLMQLLRNKTEDYEAMALL